MRQTVALQLPATLQWVSFARLIVCRAAQLAGMDAERIEDLRIAVSEATTNAIAAQRQMAVETPLLLTFGDTGNGNFEVLIEDAGPGFEPAQPELHGPRDWRREHGLGVGLIRQLADTVDFVRAEDGMQVAMRFNMALHHNFGAERDRDTLTAHDPTPARSMSVGPNRA